MKQIIIAALALIVSVSAFGQKTTNTTIKSADSVIIGDSGVKVYGGRKNYAQKKDTVKKAAVKSNIEFKVDPDKVYTITLKACAIDQLITTSRYGLVPFLKTTTMPINQLDNIQKQHDAFLDNILGQANLQIQADLKKWQVDTAAANKKPLVKPLKK